MSKNTMNAFVLTGHGDFDKLEYHKDWVKPVAQSKQVLIRVLACGLNNTDINTRTGWYSKAVTTATTGEAFSEEKVQKATWGGSMIQFPRIQGADVAGVVESVGNEADASLIGKRVMIDTWLRQWDENHNRYQYGYLGSERDGGFAQYIAIDQSYVHPIDSELSDAELATFATSYTTAENMINRAAVTAEDVVLVPGASGGVGSALIQLVKRRGATVVALCGEEKSEAVRAIGADVVLPRQLDDLPAQLQSKLNRSTVTVIADVVGGEHFPDFIDVLERQGRYTCSGAIAGPIVKLDLRTLYLRDLTFTGSTVVETHVFSDLVKYIENKEIRPLLAKTFPLEELHDAQRMFIRKEYVGNIVVCP